jgi:hypothetical protein
MMATAYTIVGILLGTTVLVAVGILLALWFAVQATRPELLERRRGRGGGDGPH